MRLWFNKEGEVVMKEIKSKNKLLCLGKVGKRTTSFIQILIIYIILYVINIYLQVQGKSLANLIVGVEDRSFISSIWAFSFLIVSLISFGIPTFLIFLWLTIYEKRDFKTLGLELNEGFFKFIRGFIVGIVIVALTIIIAIKSQLATVPLYYTRTDFKSFLNVFGIYFLAYIIQGFAEEIEFRGFIMQSINNRFQIVVAIIVQTVLFTISHAIISRADDIFFIFIPIVSIVFALYALWDESLWGVCAIHGVYNAGIYIVGIKYMGLKSFDSYIYNEIGSDLDKASLPVFFILGVFLIIKITKRNLKSSIN